MKTSALFSIIGVVILAGASACSVEMTSSPGHGDQEPIETLEEDGVDPDEDSETILPSGDEEFSEIESVEFEDFPSDLDLEGEEPGEISEEAESDFDTELPQETESEPELSEEREPEWEETEEETGEEEEPLPSLCASQADLLNVFEPLESEGDTQIHPFVLFDDPDLWIAAVLPKEDGSGKFDITLAKFGCQGDWVVSPFVISTRSTVSHLDPVMAVNDSILLVLWQGDNGTGINNMDIYGRRFSRKGAPLDNEEWTLEPTRTGESVRGNLMMPSVASKGAAHGFVMTALWGIEEAPGFQAFLQRFDPEGRPSGDGMDLRFDPTVSQGAPSVVVDKNGYIYAAWTETLNSGSDDEKTKWFRLGPEQTTPDRIEEVCSSGSCAAPWLGGQGPELAGAYLGVYVPTSGSKADIHLLRLDPESRAEPERLVLGAPSGYDHTPVLATGSRGGAVLWYRMLQGIRSEVWIQGFVSDGATFESSGEARTLNDTAAPGYFQPALASVGDNVVLAVWAEGTSPAFRLKALFVDLSPSPNP